MAKVKERRVKEVEILLRESTSTDKDKMGGEEVSTMRQMEVSSSFSSSFSAFSSTISLSS